MDDESILVPRRPSWSGAPLLPQHLQCSDAYDEEQTAFLLHVLAPQAWGVSDLSVEVTKASLRVTRFAARFPSGLSVARHPSEKTLERPLSPDFDGFAMMDVFLGISRAAPNAPNVSADEESRYTPRFVHAGEAAVRPLVRILFGTEGEHEERIPIARVQRAGTTITLAPWHLPPMIRIPSMSPLVGKVGALVKALEARRAKLLEARRSGGGYLSDTERFPQLRLLYSLNRALANLSKLHVYGAPEPLFCTLASLLGGIQPLAHQASALPRYSHENPGPAFREVIDRLLAILPLAARDPFVEIPLVRAEGGFFHAHAPGVFRRRIYLVASKVEPTAAAEVFTRFTKVAARHRLGQLLQHSVAGVQLSVEFEPPGLLPCGSSDLCLRFNRRSEYWDEVAATGTLSVFIPQAHPELTLTLYAMED